MSRLYLDLLLFGAVTLISALLAGCASTPTASPSAAPVTLSAPLTFLRDGQIWRLPVGGSTAIQITREAEVVESFDVSPADGALVYVTGNKLIWADAQGGSRRELLAGPGLPPVRDTLAALNDPAHITGALRTPIWSPDGARVAYVQNGLTILTVATGAVERLWRNPPLPATSEVQLVESVLSWSPDGQHLLATTYPYPLGSLYSRQVALKAASSAYLLPLAEGAEITAAWSADSAMLYLANPTFGGTEALSRCTVSEGRCTFIGEAVPARSAAHYRYPHVAPSGDLYVWLGTTSDPAKLPERYQLSRLRPDGYGRTALRADSYPIAGALWAKDGSGVLIATEGASDKVPAGTLIWLPIDGSAAWQLPVSGASCLRWGAAD